MHPTHFRWGLGMKWSRSLYAMDMLPLKKLHHQVASGISCVINHGMLLLRVCDLLVTRYEPALGNRWFDTYAPATQGPNCVHVASFSPQHSFTPQTNTSTLHARTRRCGALFHADAPFTLHWCQCVEVGEHRHVTLLG